MNINLVIKWLKEINESKDFVDPPGCYTDYVQSPVLPNKICCTVGIIHEHRFAFYYWAQFFQQTLKKSDYSKVCNPVLVTIDYHDDVGVQSDFNVDELTALNLNDRNELGLFCWRRLRSLNDGHIMPALYLNFFSNVYVLLKRGDTERRCQKDRFGNEHIINYFCDPNELIKSIQNDPNRCIYLDIDLDYFSRKEDENKIKGANRLVSDDKIKYLLCLDKLFMSVLYPRIVGITVALEPSYCGGMINALHVLDILNEEFFNNSLCTDNCRWKK